MSSLTTWARIEPHARTTDIAAGLAAEIADPLWLLLRQWQVGELTGVDGGSPVAIDIATSWSRFSRFRAEGTPQPGEAVPLDADHGPFERVVEREAVLRPGDPQSTPWVAAIQAGRSLRRHLVRRNLAGVADRLAEQLTAEAAFQPSNAAGLVEGSTERRYRTLLASGTVIDGVKVLGLVRDGRGLPESVIGEVSREEVNQALTAWQAELEQDWGIATAGTGLPATWVKNRLEYAFSVAAPPLPADPDVPGQPPPAEVVLRAAEYDGTGLAWHSLDLDTDPANALGAGQDAGRTGSRIDTVLASPLRYPAMPADRFWDFEDATVSLGRVTAGPTDLSRILAVDFALVYSPDWFVAPVELPAGCVGRIDWVIVRDTFGTATLTGTYLTQAGDGAGRQFQPSNITGTEGDNPLMVLLPSAVSALSSPPEEDIALQRDEVANMAWSIEKLVLGPSGRGVPRPGFRSEGSDLPPGVQPELGTDFRLPPATSAQAHDLIWRLATPVAASWSPLVAVQQDANEQKVLRKARLLETTTDALRSAKSQIMRDVDHDIYDEEITRAGVQIRMVEQLTRWHDGSSYIWRGREKRPWRGEATSGLRFDATTP